MSENRTILRRRIEGAKDLKSVVRTLKAISAANITPYENAVVSLREYDQIVKLGLSASFKRNRSRIPNMTDKTKKVKTGAILFGTDQGMVGQFNNHITNYYLKDSKTKSISNSPNTSIWSVGEIIKNNLIDNGIQVEGNFETPVSVTGISSLVAEILNHIQKWQGNSEQVELIIYHNKQDEKMNYNTISTKILPMDLNWLNQILLIPWPNRKIPESLPNEDSVLRSLIREYIFVSLYLACVESLSSESICRYAAMQNTERSVVDLIADLTLKYNHGRQEAIDEELADLINGYVVLGED
ncbi:MAG: F0F1 ATP synthase subunit gamma [Leptospira sp.]|nr:F0F1 ATP synthase subunit gamma [Leptospira sp.]